MDVDTSYEREPPATSHPFPAIPHTAGPITTGFNNLFNDPTSPTGRQSFESPVGPQHKKHRSHSPGTTQFAFFVIDSCVLSFSTETGAYNEFSL